MHPRAPARFPLLAAGLFGLSGVGFGAFGAHALAATLAARGMEHAWDTGTRYQLMHAVALLGIGSWLRGATGKAVNRLSFAALSWSAGIILFSGSLYGIALGGPRWLGPVTPLGGAALLLGWVFVVAAAWGMKE